MVSSQRCVAALAALCAAPCLAATAPKPAPKPAAPRVDDLTVAAVYHVANCPLPKQSPCVLRKPVDTGYRVLTAGVELDDKGDHWIADFTKANEGGSPKLLLRILDRGGELHDIDVSFTSKPIRKNNSRPPKK